MRTLQITDELLRAANALLWGRSLQMRDGRKPKVELARAIVLSATAAPEPKAEAELSKRTFDCPPMGKVTPVRFGGCQGPVCETCGGTTEHPLDSRFPCPGPAEPAQPSEPAKCPRCGKIDHEDGGCYIDDDVSHEACSECGRSFGDLAEMADTGKCVDCAERPSSEPAGEVTTEHLSKLSLFEPILDETNEAGCTMMRCPLDGQWLDWEDVQVAAEADIRANIARATEADKRTIAELEAHLTDIDHALLLLPKELLRDDEDVSQATVRVLREMRSTIAKLEAAVKTRDDEIEGICAELNAGHRAQNTPAQDAVFAVRWLRRERDTAQARVREMEAQAKGWRCFHCGEVFFDEEKALEHFGPDEVQLEHAGISMAGPACQLKLSDVQQMESELGMAQTRTKKAEQERDTARTELERVRKQLDSKSLSCDLLRRRVTEFEADAIVRDDRHRMELDRVMSATATRDQEIRRLEGIAERVTAERDQAQSDRQKEHDKRVQFQADAAASKGRLLSLIAWKHQAGGRLLSLLEETKAELATDQPADGEAQ